MVQTWSKKLDSSCILDVVLMHRLLNQTCLLYTSDAADDLTRVDLGGRRIIKKGEIVGPKAHHSSFDDDQLM